MKVTTMTDHISDHHSDQYDWTSEETLHLVTTVTIMSDHDITSDHNSEHYK